MQKGMQIFTNHPHLAFVERDTTMQFNIVTAGMTNRTMPPVALPYLACMKSRLISHQSSIINRPLRWSCATQ